MGNVLAKAAICFANSKGGSIVLGVLDSRRGPNAIVETKYTADWCRQRIHELTSPSIITDADVLLYENQTLLHVRVPQGIGVHEADGRFYRRVGRSCECMSAIEIALLIDERQQSDGTQLLIADFPSGAVRESVANALVHSDYRKGGTIVIEHSGDSLRITSPGGLPQGVTPDNILTHTSQPRNTRLFRFAELIRIAEERGLGIDRMVRESIAAGNPVPQVLEQGENTVVIFTKGRRNRSFIDYVLSLPPSERDSVDTLLIVHRLLTSKTLSTYDTAQLIQKTPEEAASVLDRLAGLQESSPIEPTRESRTRRHPVFRFTAATLRSLRSAVSYNKPPTDDIERKVSAHLNEFGKISNKTLRNMLDIDVFKARDVLKRLVRGGIIVRTSEQSRGRNVEYGPGEKFKTENYD